MRQSRHAVAPTFARSTRIADQIQKELAGLIRGEMKDPRLGLVTITSVDVTRDLKHAKVFVSSLGDASAQALACETLMHATGFLRTQLAHRLRLRGVPQLHFVYDRSVEEGVRLSVLIDRAVESFPSEEADATPLPDAGPEAP